MNRLECKNISKSFGQVHALNNVSFVAEGGEVLALLGGNGSGKSTISKIIGGVYRKDSGSVILNGENIEINSPGQAKKKKIIVTSQELSLMNNFTVAENICMSSIPQKGIWSNKRAIREKAAALLKLCGLEGYEERSVDSLEENEKYMVEFAKAIYMEPTLLVLDEITSALYKSDVAILRNVLIEMKKKGCIIIIITHRMNEIYEMTDKVVVLRNGEYIDTFETASVSEGRLLFAMTGKEVVHTAEEKTAVNDTGDDVVLSLKDHTLKGFREPLDFEMRQGEVIAVAGLQGQGQSQLVRELFGIEGPVKLDYKGKAITIHNPKDAVNHKFAFVSGNRVQEGSFNNRSIMENLSVVSDLIKKMKNVDKQGALDRYKVKFGKTGDAISTLSGGNQQKVILARWTMTKPEVLLLDDPTKGIDVGARADVHQIIKDLSDEGTSVVFVSSDEEEIMDLAGYCSRFKVLVMYEGQINGILTGDRITKEDIYYYAIPQGGEAE